MRPYTDHNKLGKRELRCSDYVFYKCEHFEGKIERLKSEHRNYSFNFSRYDLMSISGALRKFISIQMIDINKTCDSGH